MQAGAALYSFHPSGPTGPEILSAIAAAGFEIKGSLVWVKDRMVLGHSDHHYRHEPIAYARKSGPGKWGRGGRGWYGGDSRDSVIERPRPSAQDDHPTAKPVEVLSVL